MSSHLGKLFTITTWGESHGPAVGVVVDGCPSGMALDAAHVQKALNKRRPGQNKLTTPRNETDKVEILSGIYDGKTTGTPISMLVKNADARSKDYDEMAEIYRPSHADYTYDAKYGFRDHRGGGRSSARETVGRVAAGAIAEKLLREACGIQIVAYVSQIGSVDCEIDPLAVKQDEVEKYITRCPHPDTAAKMEAAILQARKNGDSLGGVIQLAVTGVPPGWGEPVFDRVEARLAAAFLSIPATKGFEIGSGFEGTRLTGSTHNDPFTVKSGKIVTETNRSGGVQGGITNGMPILARIAFKPTATITSPQNTVNRKGEKVVLKARGRHDPCVLPRAVVIVEAMAALTLADYFLLKRAREGFYGAKSPI